MSQQVTPVPIRDNDGNSWQANLIYLTWGGWLPSEESVKLGLIHALPPLLFLFPPEILFHALSQAPDSARPKRLPCFARQVPPLGQRGARNRYAR
jgi:hypothetical protein